MTVGRKALLIEPHFLPMTRVILSMTFSQTSLELALAVTGDAFLEPGHIPTVGSGAEDFLMLFSYGKTERGRKCFKSHPGAQHTTEGDEIKIGLSWKGWIGFKSSFFFQSR